MASRARSMVTATGLPSLGKLQDADYPVSRFVGPITLSVS